MSELKGRIDELLQKLEKVLEKQHQFSNEVFELKGEIFKLKAEYESQIIEDEEIYEINSSDFESKTEPSEIYEEVNDLPKVEFFEKEKKAETFKYSEKQTQKPFVKKSDLEKFIGENLISKIGIIITVIGVAIGAKYSIEHQLISPLTRIILGYIVGLGLLGFGIKLKQKYEKYSAVLVSGSIAIMYFITYAAYGFYELIPQVMAFLLMFMFTVFAVIAALNYNNQIIAHIGLVGAYAVPFLLSDGSGKVFILFSYMAIINIGILFLAFKKYWKPLYYVSFGLTWFIFVSWFGARYENNLHFNLSLIFISIYFLIFYVIFLAYKLIRKENFNYSDIILLLINSFVFYSLGYSILESNSIGNQLLGLFTLANAIIHFAVCSMIYKQKLADRNLFFLILGLVLVFITAAIPVQLDGNYVTLFWVFEALILFWIGRAKKIQFYEYLSYPMMILSFVSLYQDWHMYYNMAYESDAMTRLFPIFNIAFLTSLLFLISFGLINYINFSKKYELPSEKNVVYNRFFAFIIPMILLIVTYFTFSQEISNFWDRLYFQSKIKLRSTDYEYYNYVYNEDFDYFKNLSLINYTLLFFSLLTFVNIKKLKNILLGKINFFANILMLFAFLIFGLYNLSELRDLYLLKEEPMYFNHSVINIFARYICYLFVALIVYSIFLYTRRDFIKKMYVSIHRFFELMLATTIIWVLSSELLSAMDLGGYKSDYKLGLSILWGVSALFIIGFGIWKKRKHLRIGGIVLFGITLLKLFIYDISHLETIAKTIVFVSLGILLLIVSFLYNKYKHIINNDEE